MSKLPPPPKKYETHEGQKWAEDVRRELNARLTVSSGFALTAPVATGYITVEIDGVQYKIPAVPVP